jgi:mannose-1-phosphate guanylyltransferase/mannose-6-phosphate isomerase
MSIKITPIILSGGSGTRLWPLSRKDRPKQYLNLSGSLSMLQETILRFSGIDNIDRPIIVCNENHRFLVAQQCHDIGIEPTIILEPNGRNTAPAITVAAIQSIRESQDSVLLVLSADHKIEDIDGFHHAIAIAKKTALEKKLVTFGVKPTGPNTGYGYIKYSGIDNELSKVERFVEKPNLEKANEYFISNEYLWNSGMFMFTSEYFLDRLKKFNPEIYQKSLESIERSSKDLDFIRLDEKSFNSCPSDSIDYALMEKSDNVFVIPVDIGWSDLGTFESLRKSKTKDSNGNVFEGDIISLDTNDSYIRSSDKLVATFGISNMTIINTKDALFVSDNSSSDKVKNIVNILNDLKRSEHIHHRRVLRPWGWYDSIEKGEYFQVKRLHIYPGAKLSIQRHQKRAEHWVLISGEVIATKGDIDISMIEGDSIFIPKGEIHSLSNPNDVYAEIIEVQSGSYLGEDDIERFEDIYGRADS